MDQERAILHSMNLVTSLFLSDLEDIKTKSRKIDHMINNLDNDYFIKNADLYEMYKDLFEPNGLSELKKIICVFKESLDTHLKAHCAHEWTRKIINADSGDSEDNVHCKKCLLTKRKIN